MIFAVCMFACGCLRFCLCEFWCCFVCYGADFGLVIWLFGFCYCGWIAIVVVGWVVCFTLVVWAGVLLVWFAGLSLYVNSVVLSFSLFYVVFCF